VVSTWTDSYVKRTKKNTKKSIVKTSLNKKITFDIKLFKRVLQIVYLVELVVFEKKEEKMPLQKKNFSSQQTHASYKQKF
jgi:hypothetical protein